MVTIALDRSHPWPAAYAKATRALEIAARLGLPVVTLVDTPGADPSPASENAGIASSIARLFETMLWVEVPVLSIVTGEGGSGGALAFAVGNRLVIYSDAIFSVIGPEAAATILWRDAERAPEAAELQKLSAADLEELGIADQVVDRRLDPGSLKSVISYHLARLDQSPAGGWARARRTRWRDAT